jgi:hypothetical protein
MDRKAYSTDLTDPQWALIDPFLRAWKAKRPSPSGHEGRYDLREIVNAFVLPGTPATGNTAPHTRPSPTDRPTATKPPEPRTGAAAGRAFLRSGSLRGRAMSCKRPTGVSQFWRWVDRGA